jgi:hypothetical protein
MIRSGECRVGLELDDQAPSDGSTATTVRAKVAEAKAPVAIFEL